MSAKRSAKLFCHFRMIGASFYRNSYKSGFSCQRSVAGLTMLAVAATLLPTPSMAQLPVFPSGASQRSTTVISQLPDTPYTLGPGDRIRLDIFAVPEYSGEYQVLVDGTLNLPVIGSLRVQGLTIGQVSDLLSGKQQGYQGYARYVRRPIVTVSLLSPRPVKVGVSGEVNRPGSYTIAVSEGRQYPTLTQAVQLAGGTTQAANVRTVRLRRRGQTYNLDLSELLDTGSLSQDISLRDGDTVFIPTTTTVNRVEARQLASSSLGAQSLAPLNIAVVGEVTRPGTYTVAADNIGGVSSTGAVGAGGISKPPTLTKVIQLAGGTTPSADIRSIKVRRFTRGSRASSVQDIDVNLWELLRGDLSQDITLQDGDTIIIPTVVAVNPAESIQLASASFAAASQQNQQPLKIAVVGEVFRPGTYVVSANQTAAGTTAAGATATGTLVGSGSPPTVTKALQGAGGITPSANIRTIEVRRSPRNGTQQVIPVNLWNLLVAGDLSQDIILQDGDTITVPKATNFDPTEASTIASASFSPTSITVNVVGEVQKPGPVQVPPNTPLNQALLAAGGFNNVRARKSRVDLIRLNPNGTVTKRTVELDFSQGINEKTNPTVQNNDVIVVGRSGLTAFSDTLGTVLNPITGIFSVFQLFRILGQ